MRDKATGRVVAVLVLLVVVGASLRGYLPQHERAPREPTASSPASFAFIIAMLAVSLAIIAFAVIARLQDPRVPAGSVGALPEAVDDGGRGRPSWRVVLIGLAVIAAWLLVMWTLPRFLALPGAVELAPPAASSTPAPNTSTSPTAARRGSDGDVLSYLAAATVILCLLLAAGVVVTYRKQRRSVAPVVVAPDRSDAAPAGSGTLARAAELGLAQIGDLSREPREAIIACYAAMEGELANHPGAAPQAFDTPTEVLARAVEHQALHADNAAQLVNLFAEARFSPHVMNEGHRAEAVQALQLVLEELRSVA